MLFNTITYALFLPAIILLYWGLLRKSVRAQNILLFLGSYFFYGWWDYRFLLLIFVSTLVDYAIGIKLEKETDKTQRKILLAASIILNLGLLFFFKYFNFFIENWISAWSGLGVQMNMWSMKIILPIGISFYTFQTLSYTIDIYKKRIQATNNFLNFATYVAFFPQLVAGPIERAKNLLPQFHSRRIFNLEESKSGFNLILWGLFKKVVIADNCAQLVNNIFENYTSLSAEVLVLGIFLFSFQIYGDFSGYSDIAIGSARLLGFKLMRNFNYPYFSRNIGEFWRRWHISLSTWFRDYLYIPLGGSKGNRWMTTRNIVIIFLVSGFWHGANWTFLIWGLLHALFFIPLLWMAGNRKYLEDTPTSSLREISKIFFTFSIISFAWIFFRSTDLFMAVQYILRLLTYDNWRGLDEIFFYPFFEILFVLTSFIAIEWLHRNQEQPLCGRNVILKTSILIVVIIVFGYFEESKDFIYFQF
ncbi:MBOAT family O-acyltransferase [Salinimicrobium sediminilitoris]|uniref:MBOAT family O-acyltransferase n=1 Tax=Salinimicrobium sediminilitoris TaxID=2876715 RepID=UPI001E432E81|nr:MBOAT family O-acyltransferase [Salinimicrobium sediminilitoris]MCC8358507.1 MBOAT family protein [Salinimicrobium sediminilitoris]